MYQKNRNFKDSHRADAVLGGDSGGLVRVELVLLVVKEGKREEEEEEKRERGERGSREKKEHPPTKKKKKLEKKKKLMALILVPYSAASSSMSGAIILQGPHQGAQKSTSTGTEDLRTFSSQVASVTGPDWF